MEIIVVLLGVGLAFLVVPIKSYIVQKLEERRALRQFRACYRQAKLTIVAFAVNGNRNSWTESEVIYLALETMKTREDIKCGKHRFGESATVIMARVETGRFWDGAPRVTAN